jgi:transcriptional regulator with GAF, ATPase, and Fis domain
MTASSDTAASRDAARPQVRFPEGFHRRYERLRPLGRGGMGEVFAAHDRLLGRDVAVKVVRATGGEEFARLQSLDLPGVVRVHDAGTATDDGGIPHAYFTMDYLDGPRLDRWLDGRPPDTEVAVVARRLLEALGALEDEGVVHGDVKPQNVVLVGSEGPSAPFPVLVDFGLARDAGDPRSLEGGTRRYLAPELLASGLAPSENRRPTYASDRYAAGRVFEAWASRCEAPSGAVLATRDRVLALLADDPEARPRAHAPLAGAGLGPATATLARRFRSVRSAAALLGRPLVDEILTALQETNAVRVAAHGVEDAALIACVVASALREGRGSGPEPNLPREGRGSGPEPNLRREGRGSGPEPNLPREQGGEVWLMPAGLPRDETLAVTRRLLTALGGDPAACELGTWSQATVDGWPEARRERLEAIAARVVAAARALTQLPTLVVASPEALPAADKHVLLRCIEARAFPRVVLVSPQGPTAIWPGTAGVNDATARAVVLADPAPEQVTAWLASLGVDPAVPAGVHAALCARATAGPWALGAMLSALHDASALTAGPPMGARFVWADSHVEGAAITLDSPALSVLWDRLVASLSPSEGRALERLFWLGGSATPDELGSAAEGALALVETTLATLAPGGEVALVPGVRQRWQRDASVLTDDDARSLLVVLERRPVGAARKEALGHLRTRRGDDDGARVAFADAAAAVALQFDPSEAARLWLLGAEAATRVGTTESACDALELAEAAVRSAELSSQGAVLDAGLALATAAAAAVGTAGARQRDLVLHARTALFRGDAASVLAWLSSAAAAGDMANLTGHTLVMEADLLRGTAEAMLGRTDVGAAALGRAASAARLIGDAHALGKISNNLGNMEFDRGNYVAAEASYADAVDAKRATGDRRGERIAETNRALAERAEGRLSSALQRATAARTLAITLGDRRGEAVTTMVLALLWLDLGEPARAAPELDHLATLPVLSAVAALDAAITRARWELAAHPLDGLPATDAACARLLEAHGTATSRGLGAARREAGWLLVAAAPDRVPSSVREQMHSEPVAALGAPERLAIGAARAWLLGVAGELGAARDELVRALQDLPTRLWAGYERSLVLLDQVASLVGSAARGPLRDAAITTARERTADRARAGLDTSETALSEAFGALGLPSPEGLARHLLSESEMPPRFAETDATTRPAPNVSLRPPRAMPAEVTTAPGMTAVAASDTQVSVSAPVLLPSLAERLAPLPARERVVVVTQALRTAAGATSACLWRPRGGGGPSAASLLVSDPPSVESDPDRPHVEALARRAPEVGAFVGRDQQGRVESLVVRLGSHPGATTVVLEFAPASAQTPTVLAAELAAPLAVARLVLDAHLAEDRANAARLALEAAAAAHSQALAEKLDEVTALRDELDASRTDAALRFEYERIVHQSPAMRRVLRLVDKVAPTDVSTLVLGESGVGKELLARAIHAVSPRSHGPFLAENTGAIPHELFESVFFGHVRGAFTGAITAQRGLVEAAAGGTLFLDEIGELRLDHQAKLLRVLQERRYRPVGSTKELVADFRLVCATNRDLRAMVRDGTFREDLYYRIAVMTIAIPPLRERREDLVPIAERLLDVQARRTGRVVRLSPAAADRLAAWTWPGNVRELENELIRAAILSDGLIEPRHLSPELRAGARPTGAVAGRPVAGWDGATPLDVIVSGVEREVITSAMDRLGHKKSAVATALGLSRPGLDGKLARFGIVARRKPSGDSEKPRDSERT